jgi:hypothetical protein
MDVPFPVDETWLSGNFAFNGWKFFEEQGNWSVSTTTGNPAPTAVFTGTPATNDYSNILYILTAAIANIKCFYVRVEFDYKLNDISAGGTEKLSLVCKIDSVWNWKELLQYHNNGSTGWIHGKIIIPGLTGKYFKIGFKAYGENSSNISEWMVDNILITGICCDPENLYYEVNQNVIILSWDPPCTSGISKYIVKRTDPSGNPPYDIIGETTQTEYHDTISDSISNAVYRYIVNIIYYDTLNPQIDICMSPGEDTITVNIPGIEALPEKGVRISPNPASSLLNIESTEAMLRYELFDLTGNRLSAGDLKNNRSCTIPVMNLNPGIYFIKFLLNNGNSSIVKFIKQ